RATGRHDPLSWLAFSADIKPGGAWSETLARLTIASRPDDCPSQFNKAYTRYRRDKITLPFRHSKISTGSDQHELEVILSEHYGGSAVYVADHLERFFFARGLGLVRWER